MAETKTETKTAEILVYGVIDEFWGVGSAWFARQMSAAAEAGATEIVVRINSAGGSVFEGISIYNALASSEIPTRAVVDGLAASAASIILQGADTREMRRGSFVMVHHPAGVAMGDSRTMRKMADDLDAIAGGLVDIYAESTGKTDDEIREMMDAETWFGAKDAVEAGFADEVLKNSRAKVAPRNQVVVLRAYRNLPEAVAKMAGVTATAETPSGDEDGEMTIEPEAPAESEGEGAAPEPEKPDPEAPKPPVAAEEPAEKTVPEAYAREVATICARAGMADRIDGYLASRTPIETVKDDALAALCKAQDATHVDGRKPAKVSSEDPYNWRQALSRANAYAN